jgi:hypothetical protein
MARRPVMGILETLPVQRIQPFFALLPVTRSLLDQSVFAHVLTQQNEPQWRRINGIDCLALDNTGYYTSPHVATLNPSNLSMVCWGPERGCFNQAINNTFVRKLGAGGRYQVYCNNATQVSTYNGTTISSFTMDLALYRGLGVVWEDGEKPAFFGDGQFSGLGNNAINVLATDGTFYVGTAGGPSALRHTSGLLLYDGVLTADEISDTMQFGFSLQSPVLPHDRRHFDMGSLVENGNPDGLTLGAWDARDVTGRTLPDRSGNGIIGTLDGEVTTARTEMGPTLRLTGSGDGGVDLPTITASDDIAVEFLVFPRSAGGAGAGRIIELGASSKYIYLGNAPVDSPVLALAGVTGSPFSVASGVRANEWSHMVFTRRRSDGAVRIYTNGEPVLSTTGGTEAFDYSGVPRLLNRVSGGRAADVHLAYAKLYHRYMEAAEVKRRYQPFRDKLNYQLDLSQVTPTLVNVTAGQVIPGTDYTVESGTFAVQEAALPGKVLVADRDGELVDGNMEAVGVGAWTGVTAILTKDAVDPRSGSQSLSIVDDGSVAPYASQTVLTVGETYRIAGWARSDGVTIQQVFIAGNGVVWEGTTDTDWQKFDVVFIAQNAVLRLYSTVSSAQEGWFDDVQIYRVQPDHKAIACVAAGSRWRPSTKIRGTWKIGSYRPIENSTALFNFMALKTAWNTAGNNGYALRHRLITGELALVRITNGVAVTFVGSSFLGLEFGSVYEFTITRDDDAAWVVWVKGGRYETWTSLITGVDAAYNASIYEAAALSAGDLQHVYEEYQGTLTP